MTGPHAALRAKLLATVTAITVTVSPCLLHAQSTNEDPHAQHKRMQQQNDDTDAGLVEIALPDAVLVTQDGQEVNLQSDVVGDRVVVIDFVYTTCTTVCPVLSAVFAQVQGKLDDRLGREIVMVSLSVDPSRDTPARLKAYSTKLGARDGWLWLTGRRQIVNEVLEEFGAYTPSFEDHPSMVLVGDGRSGKWVRFLGFPSAEQIIGKVDEFSAARAAPHAHVAMQEKAK